MTSEFPLFTFKDFVFDMIKELTMNEYIKTKELFKYDSIDCIVDVAHVYTQSQLVYDLLKRKDVLDPAKHFTYGDVYQLIEDELDLIPRRSNKPFSRL